MESFKCIKILFRWITEEIHIQYNLYPIVEPDVYMYCKSRKGIYRLKQASRLAFGHIVKLLAPHGYFPIQESPGLWNHHTRSMDFTLCVDDFVIKYNSLDDVHHLINLIKNIPNYQLIGKVKVIFV